MPFRTPTPRAASTAEVVLDILVARHGSDAAAMLAVLLEAVEVVRRSSGISPLTLVRLWRDTRREVDAIENTRAIVAACAGDLDV